MTILSGRAECEYGNIQPQSEPNAENYAFDGKGALLSKIHRPNPKMANSWKVPDVTGMEHYGGLSYDLGMGPCCCEYPFEPIIELPLG